MAFKGRGRARRRWLLLVLAVLLIGGGLVTGLPWILSGPAARPWLTAAANRIMAPATVEFESIRLSWTGPTQVRNVVLRDAQRDRVLVTPRAVFQWNLRQILISQPAGATL